MICQLKPAELWEYVQPPPPSLERLLCRTPACTVIKCSMHWLLNFSLQQWHSEYGATSALERMGTGSRTNPMTVNATVNAGNAAAHLQLFALSGIARTVRSNFPLADPWIFVMA